MDNVMRGYIENNRKNLNLDKNFIEFLKCEFKVIGNRISAKVLFISVTNVDMDCEAQNIATGPFELVFYQNINLFENMVVSTCNWNGDDKILTINDEKYNFASTDLDYFISDFNADKKSSIDSIMTRFCEWVEKNYI